MGGEEGDQPILEKDRFILFTQPNMALSALKTMDASIRDDSNITTNPYYMDFAATMYLLESENVDNTATIINLLNVLSDMFSAVHIKLPPEYKDVLNSLAGHLTLNREFGAFIEQEHITRVICLNGILWCLGRLLMNSHILQQ